ncbi:MAG TPA: hypothetical protein VGO47_00060, partial [Chlamydiales bacterium]|nr:hypothetical protein [Chlamydiales bacterium]
MVPPHARPHAASTPHPPSQLKLQPPETPAQQANPISTLPLPKPQLLVIPLENVRELDSAMTTKSTLGKLTQLVKKTVKQKIKQVTYPLSPSTATLHLPLSILQPI